MQLKRQKLLRQKPATIWLTGLSGSGKSTIARALEQDLMSKGHLCYILDGDVLRSGLNADLGFSPEDRKENIRRVAQVARLLNETGIIVIVALISPYRDERRLARETIGIERFIEVYLNATLDTCEKRDPKGLYKKARAGLILEFTGLTAPYESPQNPQLSLDTAKENVEICTTKVLNLIQPFLML